MGRTPASAGGSPQFSLHIAVEAEYSRVRKLGSDVSALTAERVQVMSQGELEQATAGLRAQASALERAS